MENTKTQQTGSPSTRMDDTCKHSPASTSGVPAIKMEEIQQPGHAPEVAAEAPVENVSTKWPEDHLLRLENDSLVLKVDDAGDVFSVTHTAKEGNDPNVVGSSSTDPDQVQGHGDIFLDKDRDQLSQQECGTHSSVYQNEAAAHSIQNGEFPRDLQRPHQGEDLTRLRTLLDIFESLDIHRQVTLYTRLSDKDKKYWSSIFQKTLGEAFHPQESHPDTDVVYCKNLFLKDRKGQLYIAIADESYAVDLKKLKQQMNAARNLSFASVDDLANTLQIKPGEVTPFTIMQESAKDVRVVFHESLHRVQDAHEIRMAFHPFSPLLQINVLFSELTSFMKHQGKEIEILDREEDVSSSMADRKNEFTKPADTSSNPRAQRGNLGAKVVHSDRKGKLKSYIRKNARRAVSQTENVDHNRLTKTEDEDHIKGENWMGETDGARLDPRPSGSGTERGDEPTPSIPILSTRSTPEIDAFYTSLRVLQIDYREVSLSSTSSKEMGPALGARCFLMRDRRQHYYVIISHEFYELDYGRLKKSLQPKKKLDECDVDFLPLVLGVDGQHFTPFALMNARAITHKVQVFLTQKIVPDSIVLCLQHPFRPGYRILMESCQLQRWLQAHSFHNVIGVVEEKPWPRKYNLAFSQFDDKTLPGTTSRPEPPHHQPPHQSADTSDDGIVLLPDVTNDNTHAKRHHTKDTHTIKRSGHKILLHVLSQFKTLFSNPPNENHPTGRHASCCDIQCGDTDDTNTLFRHEGSSVDAEVRPKYGGESSSRKDKQSLLALSAAGDHKEETQNRKNVFPSHTHSESDSNDFHESIRRDSPSISINDVTRHLDLYDVRYRVKTGSDVYHDDDDDDDGMWQVCHTLHLRDESGLNTYIIVGRFSEQISVKRFCRRFHIGNRLFVVNELEGESPDGGTLRTIVMTDPFSVAMATGSARNLDALNGVKVRHEMVLFSSIYMDPDMTCAFPVEEDKYLCITSQELEDYAKRVGMGVWYMP